MSDVIRREDAREAIEKLMDIHFDRQVVLAKARDAIVSLPSADRPTGRWVNRKGRSVAECDQCGRIGRRYMNYCPNCGAKMEGGDDG